MEPPPPRVSLTDTEYAPADSQSDPLYPRRTDAPGQVRPAEFSQTAAIPPTQEISLHQVVARVNGMPIFAYEVLPPAHLLEEARKQMNPEKFNSDLRTLIKGKLNDHIDRKVLVETLKSTLKSEQLEMLNNHVNEKFEERALELQKQLGVGSNHELDVELKKQGTSLAEQKDNFTKQFLAINYLQAKQPMEQEVTRQMMVDYYRAHIADYEYPAQVRWQQIITSYRNPAEKRAALTRLQQAVNDLRAGVDFGEVAKKYSDGPKAATGGQWDWTRAGSLADTDLERQIFALPEGQVSPVIERPNSIMLVKVNSRREAGCEPFEQQQDKIKQAIISERRQVAAKEVMADLRSKATIETIFDNEQASVQAAAPSNNAGFIPQ